MRYHPHTPQEIEQMLKRIGVSSIEELFQTIPESHNLGRDMDLPPPADESALMTHLAELAQQNHSSQALSFMGGGMYAHHIPPAVDQLLLRSEFYTAYTPYQAEVAQGTLQAIYEFQTMVAELFGLDVANASMYCGASGVAEAALMARRVKKRSHLVVSEGLHPEYIDTIRTYLNGLDDGTPNLSTVPLRDSGQTHPDDIRAAMTEDTAAVILGYPNFLGCIEDTKAVAEAAHAGGALLVTATWEPYAMSLLKSPGECGADIAVGEGQALAISPNYGGPGVGLFACKKEFVRQMPGRLVGETVDKDGARGYVLTLSTREQHIRRDRATSNICTNHGLVALALAIRTAMLGKTGFVAAGTACLANAHRAKKALAESGKFTLPHSAPTFNEFVVRSNGPGAEELIDRCSTEGVLPGIALSRFYEDRTHDLLIAVTEAHQPGHIDRLIASLTQ